MNPGGLFCSTADGFFGQPNTMCARAPQLGKTRSGEFVEKLDWGKPVARLSKQQ